MCLSNEGNVGTTGTELTLNGIKKRKVIFTSAHVQGPVFADKHDFDLVSIVRDPISQIISSYMHIRREPQNVLHEAANHLPFATLLTLCPQWFFNCQSRYLVAAHFKREDLDRTKDDERWLSDNHMLACDRMKWLAPTEQLDEFFELFCGELGLHTNSGSADHNRAPESAHHGQLQEMAEWLRARPSLYALDSLLHNEAQRRMIAYRKEARARLKTGRFSRHSDQAHQVVKNDHVEVILESGWQLRFQTEKDGRVDHTGPELDAFILIKGTRKPKAISFDVLFVAGISVEEIEVFNHADGILLPVAISHENGVARVQVTLPIETGDLRIVLRSPRMFPGCMFDKRWSENHILTSCAITNWTI